MYLNNLQHDDVFVTSRMTPLQDLIGMPSRRGLEQAIISNGKIVNIVSNSYGHMPNEEFFTKNRTTGGGFESALPKTDHQQK